MSKLERPYRSLDTIQLVKRIATDADRAARDELIQYRRVFRWGDRDRLDLASYLRARCHWMAARGGVAMAPEVLDTAYEITIDKFTNIVEHAIDEDGTPVGDGHDAASGIDCTNYFRAFLEQFGVHNQTLEGSVTAEVRSEERLQQFVNRHFYLSLKEASRRCNKLVHRYEWSTDGVSVTLIMPRSMSGKEKRRWLDAHVPADIRRGKNAKHEIQNIVDRKLLSHAKSHLLAEFRSRHLPRPHLPWSVEHGVSSLGLARALADEKVHNIDSLRPAIRALGPSRLRNLILDVFAGLRTGRFEEGALAQRYGVSRSTFSRFCGSQWKRRSPSETPLKVPDLWANLANLLANPEVFREAARTAGVWDEVADLASGASIARSGRP